MATDPAHRLTPDATSIRRYLFSAFASSGGRGTISQGHDRLCEIVAGAGKHGAPWTDLAALGNSEQACATLDRIREALPVRVALGEEARQA